MRHVCPAFRSQPALRALLCAAALLLSVHGFAGQAAAQSCTQDPCGGVGDEWPPSGSITPASGTYSQPSIAVRANFGDGYSFNDGSLVVKLNGTTITSSFQYTRTHGTIYSPAVNATVQGTVALQPGVNTLAVTLCDVSSNCTTETATYAYGVPGVSVGPDGGAGYAARGNPAAQTFTVTNTGPDSATFTLQATCREVYTGAAVSACTPSPSSVTLNAGASTTVSVAHGYNGAGSVVSVELRARHARTPTVQDLGWVEADVRNWGGVPYPMSVSLVDLNSAAQISRDECVTVSVGTGAAYECGDLRLAHGVPGMATIGRARAPVLLYNSQHASPQPTVYADVTLPEGVSPPQQVVATVTTAGGLVYTRTFTGSDWWPGMTRRIGVQWDGRHDGWWAKGYTLQVTAVYANGVQQASAPVQGELALVNRMNGSSSFGAGWWLAGLEQMNCIGCPGSNRGMLQSGDGSTRVMRELAWNLYVIDNPDGRPDTMTLAFLASGAQYTRKLQGGGEVHFDGEGRHVRTVSRLNDTTHFSYDGQTRRLLYASVPGRDGVARGFRFTYGTDGYLNAVTPEINGVSQPGITVARDGARVLSITDPDGLVTRFGYADASNPYRITSRTSRDSTVVTYGYDVAGKLSSASLALNNTQNIVTTFEAAESRGVNPGSTTVSAALVSQAYTLIDGPRTDVADQTRIWVTNRGAPRRIRDAMGGETLLRRTNATYPSLVTEVLGTNAAGDSLVVKSQATYDGRGRLATSTAVNPLGNGQNLTTTYAYDDLWDAPTTITAPGVAATEMAYDPATGNVLWQQQGGSTRRVHYDYYTSGTSRGLLARVRYPHPTTGAAGGGGADSLGYDPMGNLRWTRSPLGALTYHYRDTRGRDSVAYTPVHRDSSATEAQLRITGLRMETLYDVMGRVRRTTAAGPATMQPASGRVPARITVREELRTGTQYDAMGRPVEVSRWSLPDSAGVGTLSTYYGYDRAGRKIIENSLATGRDSTAYDLAGNPVAVVTARGHTVTMQYDALGRLVRRSVPAASDPQACPPLYVTCTGMRFPYYSTSAQGGFAAPAENFYYRYDMAGNQVYAENLDAIVTRTYLPGGALRTDTTRMRTYAGMDYTQHVFGLEYGYDAVGRLQNLKHPGVLTGTAQSDAFAYDPVTGALTQAWSRQGYLYGFEYDLLGRPVRTLYPGGGSETVTYDAESRRATRIDSTPTAVLAQDAFAYDARGKMTYISGMAGTQATHFYNWYSGLGNLVGTDWLNDTNAAQLTETMTVDAMGNVRQTNRWADGAYDPTPFRNTYQSGAGRVTSIAKMPPAIPSSSFRPDSTYRYYDAAGNVTWGIQRQYGYMSNGNSGITSHEITRNYYGADGTVRAVQVHAPSGDGSTFSASGLYSEYRYDPLGRRIMERTRRDAEVCYNNGDNCQSTLTRFVWAGDQLLWELRVPGGNDVAIGSGGLDATSASGIDYGRVSYFHAGGIDKPLLITKEGVESVVPRDTWRGQFHKGTSPVNGAVRDCAQGGQTGCLLIAWPGWKTTASHAWGEESPDIRGWYGGLVDGMRDASGQMYMRNRYYDPATGQFTQTDPIGLAGGMNAYGFADGDPVSYTDPYGLLADTLKYNGTTATLIGDDGKTKWSGPASSGQPGSTAADQASRNYGPIPEGTYTIDPADIRSVSGWRYVRRGLSGLPQGHVWSDWGSNRVRLTPSAGTNTFGRSDFFLHGGRNPGSLGCIDVGTGEGALFDLIRQSSGPLTVVVDYASGSVVTTPSKSLPYRLDLGLGNH